MRLALGALLSAALSSLASGSGFDDRLLSTVRGDPAGGAFGAALASAGDVNGDGFLDLVVGAPDHDGAAGTDSGKALVYLGSATGYQSAPHWSAEGELPRARFGRTVSAAGDVDGDGFDDVVIGSPEYDPPNPIHWHFPGRIYVYRGSAQGLSTTPAFVAEGRAYDMGTREGLGSGLGHGDFNGDGFSDVAATQYAKYNADHQVFYGGPDGLSHARVTHVAPHGSYSGHSLAIADLNGDGFDDLFVTLVIPLFEGGGFSTAVHLGSASGLPDVPPPPAYPPPPTFVLLQWATVASIGDFDGDGFDDVAAALEDPAQHRAPTHMFFRGSSGGPVEHGEGVAVPGAGRLAPMGDINGDGFADLIADDGTSFYLYFGSPGGFRASTDGMAPSRGLFAAAGDVDRDGFADILVGDPTRDRVDLYRGGPDFRVTARADVSVQIEPMGPAFWITVANHGPDPARVRVHDFLGGGAAGAPIDALATILPNGSTNFYIEVAPGVMPSLYTVAAALPEWVVDPDLTNNHASLPVDPAEEALFSDGFESGTADAWSAQSASGVQVSADAALEGAFGLQVLAPIRGAALVRDDRPSNESVYHARFRFDADGFGGAHGGDRLLATLFRARGAGDRTVFDVSLERRGRRLFVLARAALDDGSVQNVQSGPLDGGPHVLDVGWSRAGAPESRNGVLALRIDGRDVGQRLGLDNYDRAGVESVELGLALRAFPDPPPARRTVVLDSFASWRRP